VWAQERRKGERQHNGKMEMNRQRCARDQNRMRERQRQSEAEGGRKREDDI
jgi:hypothetical protein